MQTKFNVSLKSPNIEMRMFVEHTSFLPSLPTFFAKDSNIIKESFLYDAYFVDYQFQDLSLSCHNFSFSVIEDF